MIFIGGGQGWFGFVCAGLILLVALPSLMRWFLCVLEAPDEDDRFAEYDQSIHHDRFKMPLPREWNCPDRFCRTHNPSHARFCRTCGKRRPPRELFNNVA